MGEKPEKLKTKKFVLYLYQNPENPGGVIHETDEYGKQTTWKEYQFVTKEQGLKVFEQILKKYLVTKRSGK
ncbi:MAG: hypothetical protein ACRENW_06895 [Thermodesulfobacteriota bacterium]